MILGEMVTHSLLNEILGLGGSQEDLPSSRPTWSTEQISVQ